MQDYATAQRKEYIKKIRNRVFRNEQHLKEEVARYKYAKQEGLNLSVYAIMRGLTHKQTIYLQDNNN